MKKETKKNNGINNQRAIFIFVMVIVLALLIFALTLFLSAIKINRTISDCKNNEYLRTALVVKRPNMKGVEVTTDKSVYSNDEKISLAIRNNEKQSIYFEPCEYLNDFEKKIDGAWQKENPVMSDNYNKSSFNKNKSATECEITLPESGEGIFRSAVQIYYNCQRPGYDMCQDSKTFYSNEFEVKNIAKKCGCKK